MGGLGSIVTSWMVRMSSLVSPQYVSGFCPGTGVFWVRIGDCALLSWRRLAAFATAAEARRAMESFILSL